MAKTYKALLTTVVACVMNCVAIAQNNTTTYMAFEDLPNAANFLPAPPDTASAAFAGDFLQWQFGNQQYKINAIGQRASLDSQYGIERTSVIFGQVLGLEIDSTSTPAIYQLMLKAGETGALITAYDRQQYSRKRPFLQMNDHPKGQFDNETELRDNWSYLSRHAANGWATALVLAEIAPHLQETILKTGYDYGMSRVIVGAHWQQSVDDAILAASAAVARMHSDSVFNADLAAAKAEFYASTLPTDTIPGLPLGKLFLPALADTIDNLYYNDVLNYWIIKTKRSTGYGTQAIIDADTTTNAFLSAFSRPMRLTINQINNMPCFTQMIQQAKNQLELAASQTSQDFIFRKRPYVKMKESTSVPNYEEDYAETSAYPSVEAQVGWGLALLLAEINPLYQDQILSRGYQYGMSSLITGYNFISDVHAGRMLASAVVARLHADSDFAAAFAAARDEYYSIISN